MAENIVELLTDVADAIREKKGSTEPINAQNFANEIKNIPSGSPFAVDFGEEIASGNAAYINALQEDIDYYNEVKARIASGEETSAIWNDEEFIRRIAWIPKEMQMEYGLGKICFCPNLKTYPYDKLPSTLYNKLRYVKSLHSLKANASEVTRLGFFLYSGYVGDIDLKFDSLTKIESTSFTYFIADRIVLDFPQVTTIANNNFYIVSGCRYADINFPKLEKLPMNNFREWYELEELHINIPKVTSQSYSVYNNSALRICHLKGMQCSFSITSSVLEAESVKYMLDNCQEREDGASYILSLNSAVKTAFLAKCDEDAEYAASLASANAKGLTIA